MIASTRKYDQMYDLQKGLLGLFTVLVVGFLVVAIYSLGGSFAV